MDRQNIIDKMVKSSNEQNKSILKLSILEILLREEKIQDNKDSIEYILSSMDDDALKIKNLKERVFDEIGKLKRDIDGEISGDSDYYKEIRKDVHKNLIDLSRYLTEISYYNNIYYDILNRKDFKKDIPINFEIFYKKINEYLMKDKNTVNQKISDIIRVLPMKMSKGKYYSVLENTLRSSFKDESKEKVEILFKRYKSIFNCTLEWDYVSAFDNYFLLSQNHKEVNYKNASHEKLEDLFEESNDSIKEIQNLLDFIRELGLIVNKYIIISVLYDDMTEEDKKHIKGFIDRSVNFDIDRILDEISRVEKELMDNTERYQKDTKTMLENDISIRGNLRYVYQKTKIVLAYLNDYYIEDEELLFEKDETIEEAYLDRLIENLIDFIDRNIRNMNNINRKVRMKKILSLIGNPFSNPDDFFDYVRSSVEFNNDKQEMKYIMDEVYELINQGEHL